MIKRRSKQELLNALNKSPAVVLTGPRQIGKTTLAFEVAKERGALYLDLERPSDL
ncbi:MAG: AAA family ATPase, partial [Gammaproteobacteria bacterium]|nr:AAA family ATPase [Gammaproteobacteria bacterium]MBT3720003.1 AAA family ATPase [Gammaproteobacteria bacterium]